MELPEPPCESALYVVILQCFFTICRASCHPGRLKTLRHSPGLEDLWQLLYSIAGGAGNNVADRFIANVDERCEGHYLKVSALADGSFTVFNARTQETRRYARR